MQGALTKREEEILILAGEGLTDKEIAQRLGIKRETVVTYWGRIRLKFGATSRAKLVSMYVVGEQEEELEESREQNRNLRSEVNRRRITEAALRESEEQLRNLFESCTDGFIIADEMGTVLRLNGAAAELLGKCREHLPGSSIEELPGVDLFAAYQTSGSLTGYEWVFERDDGERKTIEVSARQFSEGLLMFVLHDVTKRVQAEAALRESELRLKMVTNNAPVMLYAMDGQGVITFSDGLLLQHVGRKPGESVGRSVFDLYEDFPDICALVREALAGKQVGGIGEFGGRLLDGRLQPFFNRDGKVEGVIGISMDVTDLVRAQQALKEERNFISSILDVAGALVIVFDLAGNISYFSGACERLSGYSMDEVFDKPLWDLVLLREERDEVRQAMEDVARGEGQEVRENHWVTRSGEKVLIEWRNTVLRHADGSVKAIIGTGVDRTAQRAAERALRETDERLRLVVSNAPLVLFAVNAEGQFTMACGHGLSYLGVEEQDLLGRSVFERYATRPDVLNGFKLAMKGESARRVIEWNGRQLDVAWLPFLDSGNNQQGVIGVSLDVTR